MTPTIIKAYPNDIEKLLTLSKKTFFDAFEHLNTPADFKAYTDTAFAPGKVLAELENSNSEFYFVTIDDEPVGYIKLNYGPAQTDVNDDASLEVERLYVLQSQQGKQLGKLMMDFAEQRAIEKDLQYIWLGVWEYNHGAYKFYLRHGYEKFGSHQFILGADVQTDHLLKKQLIINNIQSPSLLERDLG